MGDDKAEQSLEFLLAKLIAILGLAGNRCLRIT